MGRTNKRLTVTQIKESLPVIGAPEQNEAQRQDYIKFVLGGCFKHDLSWKTCASNVDLSGGMRRKKSFATAEAALNGYLKRTAFMEHMATLKTAKVNGNNTINPLITLMTPTYVIN